MTINTQNLATLTQENGAQEENNQEEENKNKSSIVRIT